MRFTIEIDDAAYHAGVARFRSGLDRACYRSVDAAVHEGAAEARRVHQYKDQTGNLTRSIRGYMTTMPGAFGGAGEAEGVIEAGKDPPAPYASLVEGGTKAHEIRPKMAENVSGPVRPSQSRRGSSDIGTHRVALRWVDSGGTHFARVVHHPGTNPMPFMGPAYRMAESTLTRVMQTEIDGLIGKE